MKQHLRCIQVYFTLSLCFLNLMWISLNFNKTNVHFISADCVVCSYLRFKITSMFVTSAIKHIVRDFANSHWGSCILISHTLYKIVGQNTWHYIEECLFCINNLYESNSIVQNHVFERLFKEQYNMQPMFLRFFPNRTKNWFTNPDLSFKTVLWFKWTH